MDEIELTPDEHWNLSRKPNNSRYTHHLLSAAQGGHEKANFEMGLTAFANVQFQSAHYYFTRLQSAADPYIRTESQNYIQFIKDNNLLHPL